MQKIRGSFLESVPIGRVSAPPLRRFSHIIFLCPAPPRPCHLPPPPPPPWPTAKPHCCRCELASSFSRSYSSVLSSPPPLGPVPLGSYICRATKRRRKRRIQERESAKYKSRIPRRPMCHQILPRGGRGYLTPDPSSSLIIPPLSVYL